RAARRSDCVSTQPTPSRSGSTRVVLADDHGMVREALRALIEARGDIEVVAEASDGREAVEQVARHRPDVAVIDLWMPRLSGADATRQIVSQGGGTAVLI